MRTSKDGAALRQIRALFNLGAIGELTDGQLLERFSTGQGEAAELAFAALVERHGPMVLRVCRALLSSAHDAEDAFQATFLILIKKARTLWVRDSLGPWLHEVAVRTASCARSAAARRRKHERRKAERASTDDRPSAELTRALHEEIARLPERYRVPIVLCDLEGHTCAEAARLMGRPVGTVKCWRSRGRERLRRRLIRLGLTHPAGVVMALTTRAVDMPAPTAEQAVRSAVAALAKSPLAGTASTSVTTLVQGVLTMMLLRKLRMAAAVALALLAAGAGVAARVGEDHPLKRPHDLKSDVARLVSREDAQANVPDEQGKRWELSLADAIRIGLENTETIRLVTHTANGGCTIAPRYPAAGAQRFRAEAMTRVRSIEVRYWNLVQQHTQLWAAERAVEFGREVLRREQAELKIGRGTAADVAEAAQRLEQLSLDRVSKASDVLTTERQLRDVLGLARGDLRRIVPITRPTRIAVNLDRESCLAALRAKHPDVLEATASLTSARPRDTLVLVSPQEVHQQVLEKATHILDRAITEVDAQYQQLRSASRLRAAAAQRLEAQRAFYDEGRIPIDRYLDAASQYSAAVWQDAHFTTWYNIALAALEEARGTLLDHDNIAVIDLPSAGTDRDRTAAAPRPATRDNTPDASGRPAVANEVSARSEEAAPGKTFSFELTVGPRADPVSIRGSFTIGPALPGETKRSR